MNSIVQKQGSSTSYGANTSCPLSLPLHGVFNHTGTNKNVEFTVLLESLIRREPINFWMVGRMAEPRPTRIKTQVLRISVSLIFDYSSVRDICDDFGNFGAPGLDCTCRGVHICESTLYYLMFLKNYPYACCVKLLCSGRNGRNTKIKKYLSMLITRFFGSI